MDEKNMITITALIDMAHLEILQLDYRKSTIGRHNKEFRDFSCYCEEKGIVHYQENTGPEYFLYRYGLDVSDPKIQLTHEQLITRCSVRFLDDIYEFGYARRNSHHDYAVPKE